MDETFDTGDIIAQRTLPMSKFETMGTLFNRLNILGLDMLLETLGRFENEPLNRQKQPQGDFKRGKSISSEATIIDYEKSAVEIESLIRSLNPFVLAQTSFRGNILKVFTADVIEQDSHLTYSPGEIVQIEDEKFYIKTGKGLLAITSMQFGSFFTGTSKEFIKMLKPKLGESFL
jgi:methionyl-tRNA formyltransferase